MDEKPESEDQPLDQEDLEKASGGMIRQPQPGEGPWREVDEKPVPR
ncbi:MAG: hypothetical protein WCP28_21545 [Actinomycetes bacterium]